MTQIRIPTPLRAFTSSRDEVTVAGRTVREALAGLERAHPGIGSHIVDERGAIRRFVNVYLNDRDVRDLQDLETPVAEKDVLSILPAIAGGGDPTFRDLLAGLKGRIPEIEPEEVRSLREKTPGVVLIDVREQDEVDQGAIAGATHIPRGFLELKIEGRFADRDTPIVTYCAGGVRSLLAAESLQRLGYRNVRSMSGGFGRWKTLGFPFAAPRTLTDSERRRYARHLAIPEVGEEGQVRLLQSKVLLVGAGGLGCPAAYYLAAAGVGTLGIVDFDVVDESNLQRQILHPTARVGEKKTESARRTLTEFNPGTKIITFDEKLTSANVDRILAGFELVVDGSDNFATRYLVNDACVKHKLPNVHGSVYRFEGQVSVFWAGKGPCYRCLYPQPPPAELAPSCAEAGVLGVLPGVVGLLEAVEAIKILLGKGEPLVGRLLAYDALRAEFRALKLRRDPACAWCGDGATFPGYVDYEAFCASAER
jgi:sulfur-carrier protein adenylyltransferase/sulfurtransferase